MKINISYCSAKYYNISHIGPWVFYFKKYQHIKGFIFRFFGVYVNVTENNATEKLIKKFISIKK